ncbi:MAG: outer membrane protein transport protein [Campylobacterota bacterium]|nr:outer membrane protein transport protein [Campylobacterota bacterium]
MHSRKIIVLSLLSSGLLVAGAYKIPEQSLNSMALGAAYVANTSDADTAYFNPANMSFLEAETSYIEGGLTLAHLPSNSYSGLQLIPGIGAVPASGGSKTENLPIPYFHYVAPSVGKWRYGLSMVAPAGLTKRWETPVQKTFAQEFTLQNVEINPVVSYKINDTFSVGGGLRLVYSMGKVYSDGNDLGIPYKREMEGNTLEFGYNLAMAWKPTSDINVGVTYRSNIDLDEEGEANLYFGNVGQQYDASVSVPIPAALNIGISKTWEDIFTLEVVYERTFWSSYETLDFNYETPIQPGLVASFDDPKRKDWEDSNTFRFGFTYLMDERLTLMGGYAYDETPVPLETLSYELPDSDAHIFSGGFKYRQTDQISWGAAILYDKKESRSLALGENENGIVGEFSDGGAILATLGFSYRF